MVKIVADNGFEGDDYALIVELPGEEKGICVLTVRSEHLRADRNDFSDHLFSLALQKSGREQLLCGNDWAAGNVPREVMHTAISGQYRGFAGRKRNANQVLPRDHERRLAIGSDPHDAAPAV